VNTCFNRHFPESILEDYAMGALSDKDCRPLEEHLLICSACRGLLLRADENVQAVIVALALCDRVTPFARFFLKLITLSGSHEQSFVVRDI
jgi:hypothetical protein